MTHEQKPYMLRDSVHRADLIEDPQAWRCCENRRPDGLLKSCPTQGLCRGTLSSERAAFNSSAYYHHIYHQRTSNHSISKSMLEIHSLQPCPTDKAHLSLQRLARRPVSTDFCGRRMSQLLHSVVYMSATRSCTRATPPSTPAIGRLFGISPPPACESARRCRDCSSQVFRGCSEGC